MELPVGAQEVRTGLVMVELPGRFQVLPGRPTVIYDVAHNPHAAAANRHRRRTISREAARGMYDADQ